VLYFEMHKLNMVHESFSYLHNNSYTLNLDHRSTHRLNKVNQVQWDSKYVWSGLRNHLWSRNAYISHSL